MHFQTQSRYDDQSRSNCAASEACSQCWEGREMFSLTEAMIVLSDVKTYSSMDHMGSKSRLSLELEQTDAAAAARVQAMNM